jgi:hypothetical protein
MDKAARQESFLSKAKEAEREAAKAKDDEMRAGWLKIAAGYRDLAART